MAAALSRAEALTLIEGDAFPIAGMAHRNHVTSDMAPPPLLDPQVDRVVQKNAMEGFSASGLPGDGLIEAIHEPQPRPAKIGLQEARYERDALFDRQQRLIRSRRVALAQQEREVPSSATLMNRAHLGSRRVVIAGARSFGRGYPDGQSQSVVHARAPLSATGRECESPALPQG